ncbi:hypothetical protein L9F63_023171, partial [Diploptera punctata]
GGGDSSSSSESDSNYPGGDECPHIDYDTGLPVTHNYLGDNLDEMRGRTVLDDLSYQVLPLLPQPGVVLMPGQTLPLMIFYPPTISMLRNLTTTNGTFGVVCVRQFEAHHPRMAAFGTTAEIYEYCDEREVSGFRVKAKGRQRFQIVDSRRTVDGFYIQFPFISVFHFRSSYHLISHQSVIFLISWKSGLKSYSQIIKKMVSLINNQNKRYAVMNTCSCKESLFPGITLRSSNLIFILWNFPEMNTQSILKLLPRL